MFAKEVYIQRREKLKSLVKKGVGLFLSNPESPMNFSDNTFHYRQDSTFLYFFGIKESKIAAIIDFESGNEIIFADNSDIKSIIWMGEQMLVSEKASLCGIYKTQKYNSFSKHIKNAISQNRTIHYLPPYRAENILLLESITGIRSSEIKEKHSLELVKAIIKLRQTKDRFEISEIEKACAIGYEMQVTAMKMAIENENEQKIAGVIEGIPLQYGGHYSFPIILTQNGQTLHNHNHNGILKNGNLMLCDCGAETSMGYASDYTRIYPIGGKFSQKQKEIYQIVLDANNKALTESKPGIKYLDVHIDVAKVIAQGLKDIGVMKGNIDDAVRAGAHALFFPHGLGHMLGLDVHDMEDLGQIYVGYDKDTRPIKQFGTEYLRIGKKLEDNFVITNEPGIYFIPTLIDKWEGEKLHSNFINYNKVNTYRDFGGIRLEDDLLITKNGCKIIGKRVPITIEEIESI